MFRTSNNYSGYHQDSYSMNSNNPPIGYPYSSQIGAGYNSSAFSHNQRQQMQTGNFFGSSHGQTAQTYDHHNHNQGYNYQNQHQNQQSLSSYSAASMGFGGKQYAAMGHGYGHNSYGTEQGAYGGNLYSAYKGIDD